MIISAVDFDLRVLPTDLRHPATTLRQESNGRVAVKDVVEAVARRLVQRLNDFEAERLSESLLQELRSRLAYLGYVRNFDLAGNVATGRIAGIDAMGRLMVQCVDGPRTLVTGEILGHEGT